MANPQNPNTFNLWITNRIMFNTARPASGDTGDFDEWITNRIHFDDYVEAAVAVVAEEPIPLITRHLATLRGE